MRKLATMLAISTATCAIFVAPAHAQSGPSVPAAEEQADTDSKEIVVTADRREQKLQDYAGTAATFSGDALKELGVQDITDLNDALPGLTVANNGGNIEVWIRGVGSSNNTELGDPAAATHFEGVYLPRPAGLGSAFFDIERV
jgi:iron complex outermembrane recepter protein